MFEILDYKVTGTVYESSHSIIYRGSDIDNKRVIILKVLKNKYPTQTELIRFRREYEIISQLNFPGIINAYSFEKYKNSFVMTLEDFGGESISKILQYRKLNLTDFLCLAIKIAHILGEIHSQRIMHKDINPSNIIWNPDTDEVKIIDFGISTTLTRENPEIRNPNVLEGTLAYMSPEQTGRMNRPIDYRTDLYSLGATFYYMLTTQLPFDLTDSLELIHAHIAKVPTPPHELNPDIPSIISQIIIKLMAKIAEERYQSAFGVKADLEKCLSQIELKKFVEDFPIGKKDFSNRFQIPQKLYGREKEVSLLNNAFHKISKGDIGLMLVAGYTGIGKTSLVNEIHKPITERQGFFISGKFDQLRRNIPYLALIGAFRELVKQILSENEQEISEWKNKLLDVLGVNGQIIVDIIPEVELIIGQQSPVSELPPTESQNRFNFVFQKFVCAFATQEHPLVIFLDDLQWADLPSLDLIKFLLSDPKSGYMLIIGAYRDNEVDSGHPLMLTLEELKKEAVTIDTITLKNLKSSCINNLICDTTGSDPETAQPLSALCLKKTGGNPFFLNQFLYSLYEKKLLEFDFVHGIWDWEIEKIRKTRITDNVIELMTNKIQKLSETSAAILKIASIIGNQFDLKTLSLVNEESPSTTGKQLWEALQEGLIIPLDDSYKFIQDNDENDVRYKFLHDRVQQAAYSLLDEDQKKRIHYDVGNLMLANATEDEREENIFDIVNHLNIAKDIIDTSSEKVELAGLNLEAGKKAKLSVAYHPALNYLKNGIQLLSSDCWENNYKLAISLYIEASEAAYLTGDYQLMEKFSEIVLQRSDNLLDKVEVYEVKIQSCIPLNKPMKVIHTALPLLKEFGVNLPENPKKIHILGALMKNKMLLLGKSREDFLDLPEMTSPDKKAAMRFLAYLDNATYNCLPELFPITVFKRVELSVTYGNSPVSASAYGMYGTILSGFLGQYNKGYEFGKLSMQLLEKMELSEFNARTFFYFNGFVRHWKEPIQNVLQPLKEAYRLGIETGDLEISALAALLYSGYAYLIGTELSELDREMAILNQGMSRFKQETIALAQSMWWQTVLNLKDEVVQPCVLQGEACDEDKILKVFIESNTAAPLFQTSLSKIILYFLFDKNSDAMALLPTAKKYIHGAMGMCMIPILYFYDSLVRLGVYASAKKSEKRKILRTVNKNQKKIKKWMRHSPANFTNKFYLVDAEKLRVLNKPLSAMECYDNAISSAQQSGFIHEEALANELAAKFYLNRDQEKIAQTYLLEARYCYLNWGATSKVKQLEGKYPQFLQKQRKTSITTTKTSTETEVSFIDVATILKASQVISGQIVLEKLLRQMMEVVIQNAGAQKGYLVLRKNGKLYIEAAGDVDSKNVHVLQAIPVDTSHKIPASIINYVKRTQESVVLDDATQKGNFTKDPYILKNHPKSILCIPLINQGNLTGILYMENNLTVSAFTPERIQVLNLLSSQMAISIENASLYKNMTDLNIAYERFVPREFLSFLQKESITDVKLGENTQKEMTILFSDIRDFTALSEQMSPQENFKFINSYLGRMEPIIGKYSGFIDKYIGDAIMALFPTSADDALFGGINMLKTLSDYNAGRKRAGYVPIRIGIGLNTGSLMLGTIGGLNRMDGTVISDAVNVASRVQDMTKKYGTPLLITDSTYSRLKDAHEYKIRMVDKVKAKGKSESVTIYEVFDADLPELIDLKVNSLENLEQGFSFYYQKEFQKAKQFFEDVLKFNQEDKIAQIYQHRCEQNLKNGVPEDWDGVETLLQK